MLEQLVADALTQSRMRGESLLIAVSGGPDSLALLHALCRLQSDFNLTITAAHFNHKLRPDADADAAFVADQCARLGVPCAATGADVAAYRRQRRLSLEDAARQLRYAFLADAAAQFQARAIALGHTADDQAETVLMNIIRGSGVPGLRAMQPISQRPIRQTQTTLFRPLLAATRAQTAAYCADQNLVPRQDPSNQSLQHLRNRVRLDLLPAMEAYNPAIRSALARLSAAAAEDDAYIQAQADAAWTRAAIPCQNAVALSVPALRQLPPAIQTRIIRRAVQATKGDAENIARSHITAMLRAIAAGAGKSVNLPDGLTLTVGYREAVIAQSHAANDAISQPSPPFPTMPPDAIPLAIPGQTHAGPWLATATLHDVPAATHAINSNPFPPEKADPHSANPPAALSETMDYDAVCLPPGDGDGDAAVTIGCSAVNDRPSIRARVPGDRFQPLGMAQSKKLKDFMSDERIPRQWRGGVPLLATQRGVACVFGWRIAHWARATPKTKRLLRVRLTPIHPDA